MWQRRSYLARNCSYGPPIFDGEVKMGVCLRQRDGDRAYASTYVNYD